MFRSLISLALACAVAGCAQQGPAAGTAQASELNVPATLIQAEAPEGWVTQSMPSTGKIVVEDGRAISELPPVKLVFVQGQKVAMDGNIQAGL